MKKYTKPTIELEVVEVEDICAVSLGTDDFNYQSSNASSLW